jgi:hypothetical protein
MTGSDDVPDEIAELAGRTEYLEIFERSTQK